MPANSRCDLIRVLKGYAVDNT